MKTRIRRLVKVVFFLMIIISMISVPAFGQSATQVTLSLNKQSYTSGDIVIISGTISSPGSSNSMILQVYGPDNMLVQIGTVSISSDGKFSTSVKAEGPSWSRDGSYMVKMIYVSPPINTVATTNINFKATPVTSTAAPSPALTLTNPATQPSSNHTQDESVQEQIQKRIALANKLRDSLNNTRSSVSSSKNNYGQIPSWVKDDAKSWHDGTIDSTRFSKGIQYVISIGLVKLDWNIAPTDSFEHIPLWVKHIAGWWSQDMLSDSEYANSIQYLLQHKIIETIR